MFGLISSHLSTRSSLHFSLAHAQRFVAAGRFAP